jgi:hypothetical protein
MRVRRAGKGDLVKEGRGAESGRKTDSLQDRKLQKAATGTGTWYGDDTQCVGRGDRALH